MSPFATLHIHDSVFNESRPPGGRATDVDVILAFATDVDVIRAVFERVNELRVLGGRTKAKRAEIRQEIIPFESFHHIKACVYRNPAGAHRVKPSDVGRWVIRFGFVLSSSKDYDSWCCRVFADDWSLYTGLSAWRVYDGAPLIDPAARVKWRACRARILAWARACVVFGAMLEEIQLRPGGTTYRRVRARFEALASHE